MGLEVMRHVMPAQLHEVFALEAEVMQRVVGHIVDHISEHKTGKNTVNIVGQLEQATHQHQHNSIEYRRERDADHRRHHQACLFPWLGMVYAVHQEQDAFHAFRWIFG